MDKVLRLEEKKNTHYDKHDTMRQQIGMAFPITYMVDHEMHDSFGQEVSNGFVDDTNV